MKSSTLTLSGRPSGRLSLPEFLESPTSSFFLLLGIDRDHRLASLEGHALRVDRLELSVPVWMTAAFLGLALVLRLT